MSFWSFFFTRFQSTRCGMIAVISSKGFLQHNTSQRHRWEEKQTPTAVHKTSRNKQQQVRVCDKTQRSATTAESGWRMGYMRQYHTTRQQRTHEYPKTTARRGTPTRTLHLVCRNANDENRYLCEQREQQTAAATVGALERPKRGA